MPIQASEITGRGVEASDGAIGTVADLLFDDTAWGVRWAVVDTGDWLPGLRVLIPPATLRLVGGGDGSVSVDLTADQVRRSPGVDADAPVSRRLEEELYAHYGWVPYWAADPVAFGGTLTPLSPLGPLASADEAGDGASEEAGARGDDHLRSVSEVTGYYVAASDGEIGHVEDFLLDRESWAIRYLLVDTRNWLPGRKVLVAPRWARAVEWPDREIRFALTRQQIEESPEYDPDAAVGREFEERLHAHFDQPPYWAG